MVRGKRKKVLKKNVNKNKSYSLRARRSSMKVNLSYVSNLSDSEYSLFKKTNINSEDNTSKESLVQSNLLKTVRRHETKNPHISNDSVTSVHIKNVTVINNDDQCLPNNDHVSIEVQSNPLKIIKEKEQQLNKSCMQLKDAIMNKTQALFDKKNELAIKTSEVLATLYSSPMNNISEGNDKRSPSIKINIGKNDQIIMSGDGRKKNPVLVLKHHGFESECNIFQKKENINDVDCNQSISSTPKKSYFVNNKNSEICDKSPKTILRIPVTRLFADDDDPNNSMSEINTLHAINKQEKVDIHGYRIDRNNSLNISNELNQTTSPILSEGTRSKFSRLSLKKKLTKNFTQSSLEPSTSISNESFINRIPLTCSSFIEKQDKTNNENKANKYCATVNLNEKEESESNCKTINLVDNENNSKTIDIESSTSPSCMELTTISCHMPIIRRSFQQVIRKSLNLENVAVLHKDIQNLFISTQKKKSTIENKNNDSNINNNYTEPLELVHNKDVNQENHNSLNFNPLLDEVNLADRIIQKENKKPRIKEIINIKYINPVEENAYTMVLPSQSICTVSSSMQVNTSLDSVRKSFISNVNNQNMENNQTVIFRQPSITVDINKERENSDKITSRQPSTSTVRSSMQVNTSLDSAQKSPITKNVLDFNKILSMVEETASDNNQSNASTDNSKNQSSDKGDELENLSLIERIRNISVAKRHNNYKESGQNIQNIKRKSNENENINLNEIKKSAIIKNTSLNVQTSKEDNNKKSTAAKSNDVENFEVNNIHLIITRKSIGVSNVSLTTNESSVIEATPYPISRSVLLKTIIKNNLDTNTLNAKRFVDFSDNKESNGEFQTIINKKISSPKKHQSIYSRKSNASPNLLDTIVLNSSDESDEEKEPIIIDDSLNETKNDSKSINNKSTNKIKKSNKAVSKRKLYPLRENSQLISFSPADIQESPKNVKMKVITEKKKRKAILKKKEDNKIVKEDSKLDSESESLENEVVPKNTEKNKKKPKKITSKKIIVKKAVNMTMIDNMMNNEEKLSQRLSRNSLREFDLRKTKCRRKENSHKNHKIIIVATGLAKEEKDLIKSVIKALGSATLEINVTTRTTHVVSSGIRTINLLKGIIRGCWLLSLEWALKSLENGKWLDPAPYEMSHFSKAVQENRRDRQLCGKAYVPELFITCGLIYIENGTTPPASTLKELVKAAGGRITENSNKANIIIGMEGLKEIWILDSITTGDVQPIDQYKRN